MSNKLLPYHTIPCLLKKKLQIAQNKVIRFILGLPSKSPTEFSGASMLPVPLRVDQLKLNHMYNIINGIAPSYLKSEISIADHTGHVTQSGNSASFVAAFYEKKCEIFFFICSHRFHRHNICNFWNSAIVLLLGPHTCGWESIYCHISYNTIKKSLSSFCVKCKSLVGSDRLAYILLW